VATEALNYIGGSWRHSRAGAHAPVHDPARAEVVGTVPLSPASEVEEAAQAASSALADWRRTPPSERVQHLFRLKTLLEDDLEDLACLITRECGKTLEESRGEMRRAVENVEVACGIPLLLQGYNSEDIARGIDETMIRQPIGVCAVIAPFNFPGMIPFWFLPYAVACGNTYIVKPSKRVPLTMQRIFALFERSGFPKGVLNLVNGDRNVSDAILDHPSIRAISFVGSTPVARAVYAHAAANGKRAQCQGGAKNPIVVMPDADLDTSVRIIADSAFGCAGQRCLAGSVAIAVGEALTPFREAISAAAATRVVGCGLDDGVQMGPVISRESQRRIEELVGRAVEQGARPLVDGRGVRVPGYELGFFVGPTVLEGVLADAEIASAEVFGPVLNLVSVPSLDEAIALVNAGQYGNQASIFTASGSAARKFRYEAEAGNVGVNVGVAAPMAFFPFSGWKESFFGDLHGQGVDAVEFFTQKKVVVERWPREWSRKF